MSRSHGPVNFIGRWIILAIMLAVIPIKWGFDWLREKVRNARR